MIKWNKTIVVRPRQNKKVLGYFNGCIHECYFNGGVRFSFEIASCEDHKLGNYCNIKREYPEFWAEIPKWEEIRNEAKQNENINAT